MNFFFVSEVLYVRVWGNKKEKKVNRLIVDICGSRILPQPLNLKDFFVRFVFHFHFALLHIFFFFNMFQIRYNLELNFGGQFMQMAHLYLQNNILNFFCFWIFFTMRHNILFNFFSCKLPLDEILCIWHKCFWTIPRFTSFTHVLRLYCIARKLKLLQNP